LISLIASLCCIFVFSLGSFPESRSTEKKKTGLIIAGKHYEASFFHRWFLGKDYRDIWATPIEVEVLDLYSFAGGLSPVMRVGGMQTLGLAMKGEDGREYTFRGVDKDPSTFLPPSFMDTLAARLIQDQTAASFPSAAVAVPELAAAVEVLHTEPKLVIMPDDTALGEFREAFAGSLGMIEEYPVAHSESRPGTFGATEIIDSHKMWERWLAGPEFRIDSRAFLRARFLDMLIGDWDRHGLQWRWAKIPGKPCWQPVAEDRDQVFASYEGLLLGWVRFRNPQLVVFKASYPGMEGLAWNGKEIDRRVLTDIERPEWMEIAEEVKKRITDEVLERAVRKLPEEHYRLSGAKLELLLKLRRDKLSEVAKKFYRHLSREVDVFCTNQDEIAEIHRFQNGDVRVQVFLKKDREAEALPYYQRIFRLNETKEVRLYLYGGDDRVFTSGPAGKGIKVRIIGGDGFDVLDDSRSGGAYFYDLPDGQRVVPGPGTKVDCRPYQAPVVSSARPLIMARDWSRRSAPRLWLGFSSDLGLFLGGGIRTTGYGFRKHPYANDQLIRGGYAAGAESFRFDYEGKYRGVNSAFFASLAVRYSGIEILHFYGYGNETLSDRPNDFFKVKQNQFILSPALNLELLPAFEISAGPEIKYSESRRDENTLIGQDRIYGSESFGQAGIKFGLIYDTRNPAFSMSPGICLQTSGSYYPQLWDVKYPFGSLQSTLAVYISPAEPFVLAARVGGKKVFGTYPFYEAAYLGGWETVRGFRRDRFAGDASLYGNIELRFKFGKTVIILPGEYGVLGFADAGRVYVRGEASKKWHSSYGGGFFFSVIDLATVFSLTVGRSEEWTSVYFRAGFSF